MNSAAFLKGMLSVSLTTGAVILFLKLLWLRADKRYAARWRSAVWLLLAVRLLIPISIPFPHTLVNLKLYDPDVFYIAEEADGNRLYSTPADGGSIQESGNGRKISLADILTGIWGTVGLLFFVWQLLSYRAYRKRRLRWSHSCKEGGLLKQFDQLSEELQVKGKIRLLESRDGSAPALIGFWKPCLIMPAGQLQECEAYLIMKHEMLHYRNHDVWKKLLLMTVNAVHWFNPAVWILRKEETWEIEMVCDDAVVMGRGFAERRRYSELLLQAVEKQMRQTEMLTENFYGGARMMKKRFINIMNPGKTGKKSILIAGILTALVLSQAVLGFCDEWQEKEEFRNHPAKEILTSENPEIADTLENYCEVRYSAISEDVSYNSYSVYGDVSQEQLEEIAEYIEMMLTGSGYEEKPEELGLPLKKLSFAFYREDTQEQIDAFMFKDGKRLPAEEGDVFVPADTYNRHGAA